MHHYFQQQNNFLMTIDSFTFSRIIDRVISSGEFSDKVDTALSKLSHTYIEAKQLQPISSYQNKSFETDFNQNYFESYYDIHYEISTMEVGII